MRLRRFFWAWRGFLAMGQRQKYLEINNYAPAEPPPPLGFFQGVSIFIHFCKRHFWLPNSLFLDFVKIKKSRHLMRKIVWLLLPATSRQKVLGILELVKK